MDNYEKDFSKIFNQVIEFEKDLKLVFEKHKVELKNTLKCWSGGSNWVVTVFINGKPWHPKNFEEILTEIKVLK